MAMMHFLFSEGPKSWEDKPLLIPGKFLSPRLSQWEIWQFFRTILLPSLWDLSITFIHWVQIPPWSTFFHVLKVANFSYCANSSLPYLNNALGD